MDNLQIKQDEIAYARSTRVSPIAIGEHHHQLVGQFVNNLFRLNAESTKLLEVGCGKGTMRKFINGSYFGIDPIELPECCEFRFNRCSGQKTPFQADYFDVIVIKDGINYYSELDEVLPEMVRILKPTGLVVFTEFVGKNYSLPRFLFKKFIKFQLGVLKNSWDKTYLGYYSHQDIILRAREYFESVKYTFNPIDERYFVVASTPKILRKANGI